ncbi:nucleotidyltransferase domain-containing protein [Bacterioplanes sanyensis]|uniref:nucleotidyltransferase domain-containing protein n=1 Tax=Bacterioplanes sanyensis TaxID=1249553 RepID=UPI0035711D90
MQDSHWKPFTLNELHTVVGDCSGWFVDGGEALDLFLGQKTREHGDLDIGVLAPCVPEVLSRLTRPISDNIVFRSSLPIASYSR